MPETDIRALIFDFDGLILDTETPEFHVWEIIYQEHGCTLPVADWEAYIGGATGAFDPYEHLEAQVGRPLDREAIWARHRSESAERIAQERVRPGVEAHVGAGRRLGLGLGIASSSDRDWVMGHLTRLGLADRFDAILTADDVTRIKPWPDVFEAALRAVDVSPSQAIVFEDSPNGVTAARRAGIYCVAVPNGITRHLPLDHADLVLPSLDAAPLETLLAKAEAGR